MVRSVAGSQSSNILADRPPQQTTSSGSTDSFMAQLASALEGYLAKSGNNSNLEIDIQKTQSQNSGVSQFLVTVKNPASTPAASAPSASGGSASAVATASATPGDPAAPATAPMTQMDAYWAAQPPAVQQLRDVPDFAGRTALAQTLANQGYKVDPQIMVWGWDPMKTMAARQMFGYTWAPSWGQTQVPLQNDPSAPPPGSIAVNTDFAKGLGITDPWA
jgi:hypothetical protein